MFIYIIENNSNNKAYVGQTRSPEKREKDHWGGKSKCPAIGAAVRKYGKENFTFSIIEECSSQQELNDREIYWISELETLVPKGYNLKAGGDYGGSPSEETREKIRKSLAGFKHTEETKARLSAERKMRFSKKENHPNYGKRLSPSHREAIGLSHSGDKHWAFNKKLKKESVEKIRLALLGKKRGPRPQEVVRKLSIIAQSKSKLNKDLVIRIIEEYASGDISQRALAKKYAISQAQIGNIVRGKCWRYK